MKVFIKSELEAKKLGENIRVARKRRGMSLTELSAKSLVSRTVLGRIEEGDPSVGLGKVFNVLEALGLLTGLSDIASPDLDRKQVMKEIKVFREGPKGNGDRKFAKKTKLVRFT